MAIQRAILKGYLAQAVNLRMMFTCDVVEVGGDTSQILWDAYMSSLFDTLDGMVHTSVSFYQYELQEWTSPSWVPFDLIDVTEAGTGTGDVLPNQSAIVLIGKALGLRHIGRKFLSGIPEAAQDAGAIAGLYIAGAAALLLAYVTPFTGIGGGTITPGIKDKNNIFRPFVGGVVSSFLGTMRRRKPGVGF